MDKDTQTLLWLASAGAIITHAAVRRYGLACLITVLAVSLIATIESFIRLNLPPAKLSWAPFVFGTFIVYSVPPAVIIGLPFLSWRRYTNRKSALRQAQDNL